MLLYIENPKASTEKLLELINKYRKLQDKISINKILLYFYTLITNYQEEKLRKQSHLQAHQKEKKYLRVNLTKELKDLYTKNYITVMKEIEEFTNK